MRITSYPGAVWLLINRITQLGIMKVIFSKTLTRTLLREGGKIASCPHLIREAMKL